MDELIKRTPSEELPEDACHSIQCYVNGNPGAELCGSECRHVGDSMDRSYEGQAKISPSS